ncbi:hypothetical protein TIFTF001_050255 [Ficus carica]|uniref:Reverse transcriptase zinc-binding domain-containing protein n=1 Tax=Ficus carica TaxID=3494 RepID=A0AA88CJ54_FICCA|nr:hypothetical protein TIFTF001_050255 [Ficus carica]
MINLKYLSIAEYFVDLTKKLNLPQGLLSLPDELRYLCWNRYPSRTLPPNFKPQNLVELNLSGSKLEKLWDGVQNFGSLKVLDLNGSENLIEIPNLSQALKVERIYLIKCTSLEHLPEISKPMPKLRILNLEYSGIIDLPKSIYNLIGIEYLYLSHCQNLKSLPTTVCKLKYLKNLALNSCLKLEYLPEILEPMPNLSILQLLYSGIKELPESLLENITGVRTLEFSYSKNLELIPPNIYNEIHLDFTGCLKLKSLPRPLSNGTNLVQTLRLKSTNIRRIPKNIKFSKLRELDISRCRFLQSLPELPLTIEKVEATGCTSLKMVSNLLTALTQPPTDRVNLGVTFSFLDCLKLEHQNLMSEFQMRALLIATEFALRKTPDKFCPTAKMCYPGMCNRRGMLRLDLFGEIYVKTLNGDERHLPLHLRLLYPNATNYVVMTTFMCDVENFYSAEEMSFNFRTNEEFVKMKRCGIRLLHVQDAMEFGIISSQYVCRKSNVVNDEGGPSLFWESILEQLRHFQVSSSRKKLCEKIWSSNLNHRYKILWWRLLRDALPVRAALNHSTCPLCGSSDTSMESAIHLFLFCEKVRPLWSMSRWRLRTETLCDFMASVLEIVLDRNYYDRDFLIYASLLVETIWRATNKLVHDGKEFHIAEIHSSVQDQFNQISTSKSRRKWRSLTLRKSCFLKPQKR